MIKDNFHKEYKGKAIDLYELESPGGYRLQITNYGCRLVKLLVYDDQERKVDVLLGYDTIDEYLDDDTNMGALVGRVANRIGNASFALDNKVYELSKNVNNKHHIHGGLEGFASVVWDVEESSKSSITLTYKSKDGDQGYPGNLIVKVVVKWTTDDILQTQIYAVTDKKTITNMTFHPYFNLMGEGASDLSKHKVQVNAKQILEFGEDSIANGNFIDLEGTVFDYQVPKELDINKILETQLGKDVDGIDYFYILKDYDGSLQRAARIEAENGVNMEIWTDQPGVQFYTSNFLNVMGKSEKQYKKHSAFCLEAQVHPNAPNIKHFPSIQLDPGNTYKNNTEYRFK